MTRREKAYKEAEVILAAEAADPAEVIKFLKENWYWLWPAIKVIWKAAKPAIIKLFTKNKKL